MKLLFSRDGAKLVGTVLEDRIVQHVYCTSLIFREELLVYADNSEKSSIFVQRFASDKSICTIKCVANSLEHGFRSVHGVVMNDSKELVFTDPVDRKVLKVTLKVDDGDSEGGVEHVCGISSAQLISNDGCENTASFVQPVGLAVEGSTLYVCDVGVSPVKIISNLGAHVKFLSHVNGLMKAFNIHWKDEKALRKGISRIQKTVTYLESQLEKASLRDHTTVESLQGPNGVPSFKTVSTLKELLKGLEKLKSNVKNINPSFLASMKTKSLTTMPNEHLHASMRERYPMPTHFISFHFISFQINI